MDEIDEIDEPDDDAHREWQKQLLATGAEQEWGWEDRYRPGSFGCHEFLDRVTLLGDLLEARVLGHPSCVLREEWHRLATAAVEAMRELYQKVGREHLAPGVSPGEPTE